MLVKLKILRKGRDLADKTSLETINCENDHPINEREIFYLSSTQINSLAKEC